MKKIKLTNGCGEEINISVPDGFNVEHLTVTDGDKTWAEIQESNFKEGKKQFFVNSYGSIEGFETSFGLSIHGTSPHLPDKRTAERILALCQMFIIAEHYNDGWKPDFTDDNMAKFFPYWNNCEYGGITLRYEIGLSFPVPCFKSSEILMEAYSHNKEIFETALKP